MRSICLRGFLVDSADWKVLYYIVLFIHYPGLAFLFFFVIPRILRIGFFRASCLWIMVWLCSGLAFNGCIFTYFEEYCELKAGMRTEVMYNFRESFAYKVVWRFLGCR